MIIAAIRVSESAVVIRKRRRGQCGSLAIEWKHKWQCFANDTYAAAPARMRDELRWQEKVSRSCLNESLENVASPPSNVNNNPNDNLKFIFAFHENATNRYVMMYDFFSNATNLRQDLEMDANSSDIEASINIQSGNTDSGAGHTWSDQYVDQMQSLLGVDVCRQLAIYRLPKDFCLTVIVPVFNESKTVAEVVPRLRNTGMPMQIILVNDGSNDGTAEVIDQFDGDDDVVVLHHEINQGKGAAIRSGVRAATGDVIVIQDADREYDPTDFRFLLQPILAGEADVAYGTRYGHCDRSLSPWWHQAVNNGLTLLASLAIGIRLSDVETCYKMTRRIHFVSILDQLQESRFGIEIELTARWVQAGLEFTERPIRYHHRWYDEGKKIGWRDGVSALRCIVKYGLLRQ